MNFVIGTTAGRSKKNEPSAIQRESQHHKNVRNGRSEKLSNYAHDTYQRKKANKKKKSPGSNEGVAKLAIDVEMEDCVWDPKIYGTGKEKMEERAISEI